MVIRYRIIIDVCLVGNTKPEFSHVFRAEVDEGNFRSVRSNDGGGDRSIDRLPEGGGFLKSEIEDMARALLVSRSLLPRRMIASGRSLVKDEAAPKRLPDMATSGINVWYCGTNEITASALESKSAQCS
jgi:hypothetical protein